MSSFQWNHFHSTSIVRNWKLTIRDDVKKGGDCMRGIYFQVHFQNYRQSRPMYIGPNVIRRISRFTREWRIRCNLVVIVEMWIQVHSMSKAYTWWWERFAPVNCRPTHTLKFRLTMAVLKPNANLHSDNDDWLRCSVRYKYDFNIHNQIIKGMPSKDLVPPSVCACAFYASSSPFYVWMSEANQRNVNLLLSFLY